MLFEQLGAVLSAVWHRGLGRISVEKVCYDDVSPGVLRLRRHMHLAFEEVQQTDCSDSKVPRSRQRPYRRHQTNHNYKHLACRRQRPKH